MHQLLVGESDDLYDLVRAVGGLLMRVGCLGSNGRLDGGDWLGSIGQLPTVSDRVGETRRPGHLAGVVPDENKRVGISRVVYDNEVLLAPV